MSLKDFAPFKIYVQLNKIVTFGGFISDDASFPSKITFSKILFGPNYTLSENYFCLYLQEMLSSNGQIVETVANYIYFDL